MILVEVQDYHIEHLKTLKSELEKERNATVENHAKIQAEEVRLQSRIEILVQKIREVDSLIKTLSEE